MDDTLFPGILERARAGEERAVAELWRDTHPRLLRYLRVAVGDDAAADVASEVWIEIAGGLVRFSGGAAAFRSWVFTIARRRAIDEGRRARRRPAELDPDVLAAETPRAEARERAALRAALGMIAALPPDQAEVVALRVVAGLDAGEVGRIVGKRPGAVRVLHHRGLRRLRAELAARGVTNPAGDSIFGGDDPVPA
jgi:RNA polymerase sigma-70 factor, ECF subfamily